MMFRGKVSAVRSLMALGKSLILASVISTSSLSNEVWNPRFFEYSSNGVVSRVIEFSFGWNKKLSEEEKLAYHQSVIHALEYAENGDRVSWHKSRASGYSVPVMTWPTNNGYCRRLHLSVIAFNMHRAMSVSACYNKLDSNWTWHTDK
jgi:surface antigen